MTTWEATTPPEPAHITTVIDASGDTWTRQPDGWTFQDNAAARWTWHEMLTRFGPVTDATPVDRTKVAALHATAAAARTLINAFGNTFRHPDEPVVSAYWALRDTVDRLDQDQP